MVIEEFTNEKKNALLANDDESSRDSCRIGIGKKKKKFQICICIVSTNQKAISNLLSDWSVDRIN